jgi:hypothetical protein
MDSFPCRQIIRLRLLTHVLRETGLKPLFHLRLKHDQKFLSCGTRNPVCFHRNTYRIRRRILARRVCFRVALCPLIYHRLRPTAALKMQLAYPYPQALSVPRGAVARVSIRIAATPLLPRLRGKPVSRLRRNVLRWEPPSMPERGKSRLWADLLGQASNDTSTTELNITWIMGR